jgi:hypothetical protein
MAGMKINFNNVRAQAAYALDKLTQRLNAGLLKDAEGKLVTEYATIPLKDGKFDSRQGDLLLESESIQKDIDDLRSLVLTIASCYEEDNADCIDMTEIIEKNGGVAKFNQEEEDNG